MPNIAKLLKQEIQRLARKEVKGMARALRQSTVALKRSLTQYKRRVNQLERAVRRLTAQVAKSAGQPAVAEETAPRMRFTSKGIRSLRRRLGISQAALAKLVGVSALAVYQWERKNGPLHLRTTTRNRLTEIRGFGRKEVAKQLAAMPQPSPKGSGKQVRRRRKG